MVTSRHFFLIFGLLIASVFMAGCGADAATPAPAAQAGANPPALNSNPTSAGSNSNSGATIKPGDIAKGGSAFSDIPIPGGFAIDNSGAANFFSGKSNQPNGGFTKTESKIYYGPLNVDGIITFYKAEMPKLGWENESWFGGADGQLGGYSRNKGDVGVSFIVGPDTANKGSNRTFILITRQEGKAANSSSNGSGSTGVTAPPVAPTAKAPAGNAQPPATSTPEPLKGGPQDKFAPDIPNYPGGIQILKQDSTSNGVKSLFRNIFTTDDIKKVGQFYRTELTKAGWTESTSTETDDLVIIQVTKDDGGREFTITLTTDKDNKGTQIILGYQGK